MKLVLAILLLIPSLSWANTRDGLVGWWKLDDGTGTSATDSSSNALTGTLNNGPTWVNNCPRNKCLNFVGASTQNISITDNAALKPSSVSIAAWVNPTTTATLASLVEKGSSFSAGYGIFITTDPYLCGLLTVAGGNASGSSTTNMTAGIWKHVAMTYDGTNFKLYINGVSEVVQGGASCGINSNTGAITNDTLNLTIGARTSTLFPYNGQIDDVRVYNRALTAQEVKDLYMSGVRLNYAPGT